MALVFKSQAEVQQEYLDELSSLKPDLDTSRTDSDWWVRGAVVGGVGSGMYADQQKISDDGFPQSARKPAVRRYLDLYFDANTVNGDYLPATESTGVASATGSIGSVVTQGLQAIYGPNGNAYQTTESILLVDDIGGGNATGFVEVQSVDTGQAQNLNAGATLTIQSPPAGVLPTLIVGPNGLSDARNEETDQEARTRILTRIRQPLTVGRVSDYEQYAREADPSVTGASVIRFAFGYGTVAVYITSGTTDIDAAIDNGEAISIIPSDELVETVQAYLEKNKPTTDCVTVLKPTPLEVDVTVRVRWAQGNANTILSGQTLTQGQLVDREVRRSLYKHPVGGRRFGASGFVLASEIEETIDFALSGENVIEGVTAPILSDRQVEDLSATGFNLMILQNQAPIPGTITIITM